ncbi:MAG TPA: HK97 family phage prohead protease [Geobacteraceae bacterium]|nr:HK97 family phage prohead protease [Geobacteraceae bacterium]
MAKVDNSAWNASEAWANGSASDDPEAFFRGICAGEKTTGKPDTQAHWALPHHYHPGDPPNAAGVRNGLSRIGQTQGLVSKTAAQAHLDNHMEDIQAAEKAARPGGIRAKRAAGGFPGDRGRIRSFPGSNMRAALVTKDGKSFYEFEGFAAIFDKSYPMYDMFGKYEETMGGKALNKSLANNPDVAFLTNHRGITMARTTNETLDIRKAKRPDDGETGLKVHAFLNADRQDVRDLASAIHDELVTEMSFAFLLNDGEWNDDYDEFTITEADINRGDVSAVNYGANPYTSISARAEEMNRFLREAPAYVIRGGLQTVSERADSDEFASASRALAREATRHYLNAARRLDSIKSGIASGAVTGKGSRAPGVAGEDPSSLVIGLDAVLDQANVLVASMDEAAFKALPPDVQQAIDLLMGADTIVDELMEALGIYDPDEPAELTQDRPAEHRKLPGETTAGKTGKSLRIWQMRMKGQEYR